MDERFREALRIANIGIESVNAQRAFEIEMPDGVIIKRGVDGRYNAVVGGRIFLASADRVGGFDRGIYHFSLDELNPLG